MIVGLISDTHGYVSDAALSALAPADRIIHAGDIGSLGVLIALQAVAPVTAVYGNCDWRDLGSGVVRCAEPLLDGVRFHVTHRPEDVGALRKDVGVVVHGHTHRRRDEVIDGVRWICPGSASEPRDGNFPSVALLEVENGKAAVLTFVDLEDS